MATAMVWSDEYAGRQYIYESPYRPIPAYMLPAGMTVVVEVGRSDRVIVTTTPLPTHFVQQWSLSGPQVFDPTN